MRKLIIGSFVGVTALVLIVLQATPVGAQYPPPAGSAAALIVSNFAPTLGEEIDIAISVVDAVGAPVTEAECTLEITSQPGTDASLGSDSVTTDSNGIASTTLNVGSVGGEIVVNGLCGEHETSITVVATAEPEPVVVTADEEQALPPGSIPDSLPAAGAGPPVNSASSNPYFMSLIIAMVWGGVASFFLVRRLRTKDI